MKKIKILITYKDKHELLASDILVPIQSGRAIAKEVFPEMIGDDVGDNISADNDKFSEWSALYWAWKNYDKLGNPDYIGHMHYRRQFVFDERLALPPLHWISSFYFVPNLGVAKAYFSDESIQKMVPQYDYLIPQYHVTAIKNIRDEYICRIPGSRADIFDTFIQVCREIHPDWEEEISKIENGNVVSVCNMFVMKKELFFDYCEFAFPVLFELQKRINVKGLNRNGMRFLGYMGEKLQTMYTFRLEKNENLKEKFCNAVFLKNDESSTWLKRMKKIRYYLLKNVTFGRKRKHYCEKYSTLKLK